MAPTVTNSSSTDEKKPQERFDGPALASKEETRCEYHAPTYLSARQKTLEAITHRLLSFVSALPGTDRHNYKAISTTCKRFSAPPPQKNKQSKQATRHKPADEAAAASALLHDASRLIGVAEVEVFEDFHDASCLILDTRSSAVSTLFTM